MSNSTDETLIPPKTKRGRNNESEEEENKDMLSYLPGSPRLIATNGFPNLIPSGRVGIPPYLKEVRGGVPPYL